MIELMVTIAVLAILVGIAIPSFNNYFQNTRTKAIAAELTSAINLARSEAITRSEQVNVCPSNDGATCGATWIDGWIVIVNATNLVLRAYPAPRGNAQVTQTPAANTTIAFGPLGQPIAGITQLVAQVSGCQGDRARQLTIGPVGRVSTDRVPCV